MEVTSNLKIPLVPGDKPLARQRFNEALQTIDKNALSITHEGTKAHFDLWQKGTPYKKQEVVRTTDCPNWGFYMCTAAGVSGLVEPKGYGEGDIVTDGSCTWELKIFGGPTVIKHGDLSGRDLPNQHAMEAIIGLVTALAKLLEDANNYTNEKIDDLIGGAPTTLDTLKEIADQLSKDSDAVAAITNGLANKVDKEIGKQLSTNDYNTVDKTKVDRITLTQNINLDDLLKLAHEHANKSVLDAFAEDKLTGALFYGKQGLCSKKDAIKYSLIF